VRRVDPEQNLPHPTLARPHRVSLVLALALAAAASTAAISAVSAEAATPRTGRLLVFEHRFQIKTWDPLNGMRVIGDAASGASPSVTADGRFVAYASNEPSGCYRIHLYDQQRGREVANLPQLADAGHCNANTRISPDGKFLVWSASGTVPGHVQDVFLYDVANARPLVLPAFVNDGSADFPSLARTADGRYLLAYTHGGPGTFAQVAIADLGVDMAGLADGTAAPVPTPGLPTPDVPSSARPAR